MIKEPPFYNSQFDRFLLKNCAPAKGQRRRFWGPNPAHDLPIRCPSATLLPPACRLDVVLRTKDDVQRNQITP